MIRLIPLALVVLCCAGCRFRKRGDDIILLPEYYRGWVVILLDSTGDPVAREGHHRIWRVPRIGVMFAPLLPDSLADYFYESADGRRTKLEDMSFVDSDNVDRVVVFNRGTLRKPNRARCPEDRLPHADFFVGNPMRDKELFEDKVKTHVFPTPRKTKQLVEELYSARYPDARCEGD